MKNILITGTSTGVGYETAILMAKHGYKVYASMRDLSKATALQQAIKADNLNIELLELDVTKADTIDKAVAQIIAQDGKIDVLLNNAGAGFAKTTEQATQAEIDWVTDINYTGVVRMTKAVLPHMREARAGRIINMSSVGGLVGQPFNELYCAAKFAVEGYTEALASYITPSFNVWFTAIEPGGIATQFLTNATQKSLTAEGALATGEYTPIMQQYLGRMQQRASTGEQTSFQTGIEVAQVILQVIEMDKPPIRIRTSAWAENFTHLKTQADPDGSQLVAEVIRQFL